MTISTAMVGGGPGSMIGEAHRLGAKAAGFQITAGVFSRDLEKSRAQAQASGVDPARVFASVPEMLHACPDLQALIVCAPNAAHHPAAKAALEAGLHVIADKPMTVHVHEAEELVQLAAARRRVLGVTYTWGAYTAFEMAARMLRDGAIGTLRLVDGLFLQDWLAGRLEDTGAMAALSRTDPASVGISGATGDLGTHLWRMAEIVTGETPYEVSADLMRSVAGRAVDDGGLIHARYASGARAVFTLSQAAASGGGMGHLKVHGDRAMLSWRIDDPLALTLTPAGRGAKPERIPAPIPGPHPDLPGAPGFLNAFAKLYSEFAAAIRGEGALMNGGAAGLSGVRFVAACLASAKANGAFVPVIV